MTELEFLESAPDVNSLIERSQNLKLLAATVNDPKIAKQCLSLAQQYDQLTLMVDSNQQQRLALDNA